MMLLQPNTTIELEYPAAIRAFVFDEATISACNVAIASGRPILLRGEPGFPRRDLAVALAIGLNRIFIESEVDITQDINGLLFTIDDAVRQAEVNIAGAFAVNPNGIRERLRVSRFIQPGPIWWAFDPFSAQHVSYQNNLTISGVVKRFEKNAGNGSVLLVEGIDAAEIVSLHRLTRILDRGYFETPDNNCVMRHLNPVMVFTTYEDRALPVSFVQRCLVHSLALPVSMDDLSGYLRQWASANYPKVTPTVVDATSRMIAADREYCLNRALPPPGLTDFLDLVRTVNAYSNNPDQQMDMLYRIGRFGRVGAPEIEKPVKDILQPIDRMELEIAQPVSNSVILIASTCPTVFISYASSVEEDFVNRLYGYLRDAGYNIKIDRIDIQYRGSLSSYVEAMGRGDAVIAVVSDRYLRSAYCMWELLQVFLSRQGREEEFKRRLFPIVLPDAHIGEAIGRLKYTQYWKEQWRALYEAMQELDRLSLSPATVEEATRMREFVDKVDLLASMVADMNFRCLESLDEAALGSLEEELGTYLRDAGLLQEKLD